MWLTANVGIAEDSGNSAHDQTIRRGQPGANPGPALNICAALDGFCRVAGAVNVGFAAFFNFGGPMKTFFLLITFYLSNNTPLHVERQATFLEGARPVRTMEECLSVAADQEARFNMAFAKGNGLLKKKVKIKRREGK